ncbi:TonB-linked SusC/RagA family outer membrane protein [Arcicella aurantiaca]|uniref:TonB-linked SusC/RagA family outer membrane protein n=1 Tax=Arcicella aurantiaca TaxID=591202 RepID=A0A316DU68_9BACT|nr:TonB-dependent receptor [Arcicella aurantiaca]PWK21614.1 TonB-linked SusC/RagA family outer membrane protein [Arcicella aurantiaca]
MKVKNLLILCLLSIFLPLCGQAQNLTIKGKIFDEKGLPKQGATVAISGTSKGTTSGVDGKYEISAPTNGTLVISFVGYTTLSIPINGKAEINATLELSTQDLKEIVVIGYGSQKKQDITSAIAAVKVGDIASRPIVNAADAITGKSPGIQVLSGSGSPGAELSVRVRGIGSPNGGEPLYVVDGVITPNLKAINPNTIESINVLKDASAAGIYGAAGSTNGVVIVTTKQGSKGKPLTEISFYTAIQQVVKKLPVLNNTEFLALQAEIGGAPLAIAPYYDVQNTNNNWQDLIYRDAPQTGINVGTSGGSEKGKYYFGAGYLTQAGIVKNSDFDRYSAKLSIEQNATDYLKIGGGLNYNRTNQTSITDNLSANFGGVITSALVTPQYVPIFYGAGSPYPGLYGTSNLYSGENPISNLYNSQNLTVSNNLLGNAFVEIALPFNIKFKSQFNTVMNNTKRDYFQDPFASLTGIPTRGAANSLYNEVFRWGLDNTLNWKKVVGSHSFDVILGTAALKETIFNSYQSAQGFGSNVVKTLNAASANYTVSTGNYEWTTNSYFGRLNYAFDNRYLATVTFRQDGSSRVGQNQRWGSFPAFSLGWKVSNEKFMENITWAQNVKIRAGWGKTGNLPPYTLLYPSYSLLNAGAPYAYNGGAASSGVSPSNQLGNSDLKWESAIQTNLGFDVSFLKNNLTLTVDYYHKKVEDLIFTQQLPLTTGGALTALNLPGFNINKGIEMSLDANIINKTDFEWNSNFNISFNKNNVEGIDENISFQTGAVQVAGSRVPLYTQIIKNNYPLGTFWGYKTNGVNPQTGNLIYGDKLEQIGSALPKYTFGFSNNFKYKNLSLSLLIDGTQGNDIYNSLRMETEAMSGFTNQSTAVLRRWQKVGDITDIPRALGNRGANAAEAAKQQNLISSHFVEDGSFVRLRNLTLGYDLDNQLVSKLGLSGVKVYFTAQNLLTLTNYSGYYPEVNAYGQGTNNQASNTGSAVSLLSLGIDRGTYPAAKTFTLGLNIQL